MYTVITIEEMINFLSAKKGWVMTDPGKGETYFDFPVKDTEVIIRVWSSICGNISRAKGKDAIRVVLLIDKGIKTIGVKKYPRVTRQENWKQNLKARILDAYEYAKNIKTCEVCGYLMAERQSKQGNIFYGCSRFPDCKHTTSIK